VQYGATENEKKSLMFRRSLFIAEDVKQGEKLTTRNLRIVRPGNGLPPKYYDIFLGRTVKCDLKKGTPVSWDIL
jgi:N-acetylneuraminate synthase